MLGLQVLLGLSLLFGGTPTISATTKFVRTGDCENDLENHYQYKVEQSQFDGDSQETFSVICTVVTTCEAAGKYGDQEALLYKMAISNTKASGSIFDKEDKDKDIDIPADDDDSEATTIKTFDDMMSGWFKFVQTEDGSVPAVFHHNAEDSDALNFKKSIVAAFQANFKGTSRKVEADPQSIHVAEYTYKANAQDEAEGIVKMHRKVTSEDVQDYSSHVPGDVVALDREEDIEYKKGVMTHAAGVSTIKMMPEDERSAGNVEVDSLEAEMGKREKRDNNVFDYDDFVDAMSDSEDVDDFDSEDVDDIDADSEADEEQTYDPDININHFEASGTYSLDLIGQRRVLRKERSAAVNHLELPEAMESTLMAHIDHTREDMYQMKMLRSELVDIHSVLASIHKNNGTSIATSLERKIEELIILERKYGALPGYQPVIKDVLHYLSQFIGTANKQDRRMRAQLYFMMSIEGSVQSQMALLAALNSAVDNEEQEIIMIYIAFTENPQPQMISELEEKIGDDTHSTDPLLLAYGALVAKASPDLQQRMTLFLLSRMPLAETNSSSLIHHVLSLGNTESHQAASSIVGYLQHPDHHVQLSSIYALRYATSDSLVQKALTTLLNQPHVSDEHIATLLQCLLYGVEHASTNRIEKPFNIDLGSALLSSVMDTENEELHQSLISYLQLINSAESRNLLKLMTSPSERANSSRLRRGTYWADSNGLYNLVSPLNTRKNDMRVYPYHKAYLWGKRFGVDKGNVQIAAGGFIGVSKSWGYKIYGRGKAVGHAFGKTKTAVDFLVHNEKSSKSSSTITRLYAQIMGKTLVNVNENSQKALVNIESTCRKYGRPLSSHKYTLFNFRYSVFIYVGTLTFNIAGYVSLNTNLYVEGCLGTGSLRAEAGLGAGITMELQAGATANLLSLARGGISVSAIFNYQLTPALSTEICYANNVRFKNCAGIYDQWNNNRIVLDVWYQLRKLNWCKKWGIPYPCGFGWGSRRRWNALSTSWNLPSSPRRTLWQRCDQSFTCNAVVDEAEAASVAGPTVSFNV